MIHPLPEDSTLPDWLAKIHAPFLSELVLAHLAADGEVDGILILQETGQMSEIIYIEARQDRRRCGIGRRLVKAAQSRVNDDVRCGRLCLDVRASNTAAIQLYETCGFERDGRRRNYYPPPDADDAVLMSWAPFRSTESDKS